MYKLKWQIINIIGLMCQEFERSVSETFAANPTQQGEDNFICGVENIEKLHLKQKSSVSIQLLWIIHRLQPFHMPYTKRNNEMHHTASPSWNKIQKIQWLILCTDKERVLCHYLSQDLPSLLIAVGNLNYSLVKC